MTAKRLVPSRQARSDVEQAVEYYRRQAGARTALGFIDAVETTYRSIAVRPSIGSPRYAHELGLPGIRGRTLKRYPYLVFYVGMDDHINIWRVLHARRDIPAWLLPS